MLRLTVSAPSALADVVVEYLSASEAVSSLSRVSGASLRPEGDPVHADVAREGANAVLDRLRDLRVPEVGTVSIEPVST